MDGQTPHAACTADELVKAYYAAFLRSLPPDSPQAAAPWVAEAFGDSPALADELAALVLEGRKTATCSAVCEWEAEGDWRPTVGLLTIVLDGRGTPLCIIETTEVTYRRFDEVDAQFAYDEGEDDRSLSSWRTGHERYFTRVLPKLGKTFSPDLPLICERFRVLYR